MQLPGATGLALVCGLVTGALAYVLYTAGLAKMVIGQKADEVVTRLEGIPCRGATSCPDQLATALEAYKAQNA